MKKRKTIVITALFAVALCGLEGSARAGASDALPEYSKTDGVTGNLNSIGSDTLNNLMTLWAETFRKLYPNVNIQIEGKGSSTAPPALIAGTAQLGPMSRAMYDEVKNAIQADPKNLNIYVHYLSAARNLERIADHCTNIAKDIIYMVEGRIVRHRASIGNR